MGNWNLSIHGVGCHHNKKLATDANRMFAKFVQELKAAGHSISRATITYGGEDIVEGSGVTAEQYITKYDKNEGG